jgi:hypothetical protein
MYSQLERTTESTTSAEGDTISPADPAMIQADRRTQLSISPAGTWRYLESLTGLLVPRGVAPCGGVQMGGLSTKYFILDVYLGGVDTEDGMVYVRTL